MDEIDVAWFAGLFEGEGSIVTPSSQPHAVVLQIFMTDEDVLRKVQGRTGKGSVRGPYTAGHRPEQRPIWKWMSGARADVRYLLDAIYPYMGERRRKKIDEVQERLNYQRVAHNKKICPHGINGAKDCPECRTIWRAAHYELQKERAAKLGMPVRDFRTKRDWE